MAASGKRPKGRFIDDYLLYLLALASHQASGEFHAQLKAMGVPVVTWRVLGALSDVDGETVSALARHVLANQPTSDQNRRPHGARRPGRALRQRRRPAQGAGKHHRARARDGRRASAPGQAP